MPSRLPSADESDESYDWVNKIGLEADAVLKKDIDLNTAGGDKAAQDAADSYASAFMMLAVILGAAVIMIREDY